MATFVIADTHFGEENNLTYFNRPFKDVDDMNEGMVRRWNSVVMPEETVFHLGDVGDPSYVKRLNGHKILIMGNHDRKHSMDFWREAGFDEVYRFPILYNDFILLQHEPPVYINEELPYAWIYGHVHSFDTYETLTKRTCCVSVERWNYTPVDINEIINKMKERS